MPTIRDSLPSVRYELHLSFDYTGEIDEYEPEDLALRWTELLDDENALKEMLASTGALRQDRIEAVSADLECKGESSIRLIEASYNFPDSHLPV